MSVPPEFDYKSSMLPDVGGSIHVQGGGGRGPSVGGGYSSDELSILSEYGLQDGGIIADKIDENTKTAFLEQVKSDICSIGSGSSIISKKDCWAVVAVIRAIIKHDLEPKVENSANDEDLPKPVSKIDSLLQINTNKEEFFANIIVKGTPTRVHGKVPANLTKKHNGGKRKIKTHKIRISKPKLRSRKKYRV